VTTRLVAGDFKDDGKSDIATFFDDGSGAASLQVWLSSGSAVTFQGASGWWSTPNGYPLDPVKDRMVAGDFDGDGTSDIATFYKDGLNAARIHVWLSTGNAFTYQGAAGWWSTANGYHYQMRQIIGRM